ncbi:aminopeptidase N [Amantichitinum ursilacus]|uniref:Aminopeptidase N n=1 Tax=Amantichitinum ursilacus TaxID=857265 RepID=A0A0N0GQJ3_9NEIS|nr:aminopeptidase N [Amantichitinum ursilacus]KPC54700.1 Aminopeptidase N [Amantichitinum ursilacus]
MTEQRTAIQRLDYTPPAFLIDRVDLTFELEETHTRVLSRLVLKRNPAHPTADAPLVLNGEELSLESIKVDGRQLTPGEYELGDVTLTIPNLPAEAILEIANTINPLSNTTLSGLYVSSGNFFTQCEAEGFRRITYYLDRPDVMAKFTTTIVADKTRYPVLLGNGNRVGQGNLDKNRHWVKWVDPFKKPSYLFALVAGKLVVLADRHTTASGKTVNVEVWVEPGEQDKCHHALASAKAAMKWDEERFGLEYDLDTYMIVAVSDFNMGAMENKGLNIFNTKYVLAKPETATDVDFDGIEAVVGHEYFHNWTGNRVTCRDWFQLSLKEGLTVFRDQEFSSDIGSRAVQRISNVRVLRERQFPEDAGPQAHPIRPDSYLEINNFYTATVYEKGSEVVRMYQTLLGREGFRKGMDLYFKRHDGQAVTCDDFANAMQDANQFDLTQFKRWYSQAGTPQLTVEGVFDQAAQTFALTVRQSAPATPGQPEKLPYHIPFAVGLLDQNGSELKLTLQGEDAAEAATSRVLHVREAEQTFVFTGISSKPVPSLLRDFSAPVKLDYPYTDDELVFLIAHDTDPFARWEAGNTYLVRLLLQLYRAGDTPKAPEQLVAAFARLLTQDRLDPALVALMLELPSENYLFEAINDVDPARLHAVHHGLTQSLARELRSQLFAAYQKQHTGVPYRYSAEEAGRRSLQNVCLSYLAELDEPMMAELLSNQYRRADNMTDRLAALKALIQRDGAETWLDDFATMWQDDALVMDKWFALQALSDRPGTLSRVQKLMEHPAFAITNPNKVRSLIGAFCHSNLVAFHAADGYGYAFAADRVLQLDKLNPQIAARMAACFNRWTRLEPGRRALMKAELERIAREPGLSSDTFEIVSKALQAGQ